MEGKEYSAEDGVSVLDGALSSGLVFNYSCKNGQCGVCEARLISGEVEELSPQIALLEEKTDKFLTCCCKPVTDIVIDSEDLSALHGIDVKTIPVRISRIDRLSPEVVRVLVRYPKSTVFKFLEGQYVDIIGRNSVRRSYSIANTALDNAGLSLLIKKVEKGVLSDYWFNDALENDLLRVEGPKGTFYLRDKSKPLVFLATGTGISPILSMLYRLDEDKFFKQEHTISIIWGNRTVENFFWEEDFKNIKVNFYPVLSKTNKDWNLSTGYVQDVALSELKDINNSHVYACGSNDMITSAKNALMVAGLSERDFFSDAFLQSQ